MRVLLTGASGFLGSALSDALLARGDEVIGLTRDPERARSSNPTVGWYAWNATAERPPAAALQGVDAVVNLIGEPIDQRWTDEAKRRIRDSRDRATKNLVDALSAADPRPRTLVSQSAVGYYGDRGDAIVDESTEPGTAFDAGVCVG
jgi:NAD dependent epimerase/dehydratase family enzyme